MRRLSLILTLSLLISCVSNAAFANNQEYSIDPNYSISLRLTTNGNTIFAEYNVSRQNNESKEVDVILALYDETDKLKNISIKKENLSQDTFSSSIQIPDDIIEKDFTAKAFIWENKSKPVTLVHSKTFHSDNNGAFFNISDVKLTDGIFKTSQEVGKTYLLSLDIDRLIAPCYEAAGLTPKKPRYSGWEAMQISGHSLGHYMSALAVMYQATGDKELKNRLDYAVSELSYIQKRYGNGYVGGVSEAPFKTVFSGNFTAEKFSLAGYWVPWYSIHKIYQGLIDAYKLTDNIEALDVVIKFADWAKTGLDNLSDSQMQYMLNTEHGGMNEVFAQLYAITGNQDYLKLAERFTHKEILNPLINQKDQLTGLHANTQIPKIIGAAAIYNSDNSKYAGYKTAAEFFWNTVTQNRSYVFGGNSVSEHFEALGLETLHIKSAESCNTHNMLILTEYLYEWQHNSAYMDYFENALYNHILGTQDPDTGHKTYFTSTLQGHFRIYSTGDSAFWCCTGTGFENPGRYNKGIYYKDGDELYVNLFIASELNWRSKNMRIKQETNFPYEDRTKLTITEGSGTADIKIRVPSWINGELTAMVNGEETFRQSQPGYLTISRSWKAGDTIDISLPMALTEYVSRDDSGKVAFKYGPIVLAGAFGSNGLPNDTVSSELNPNATTVSVPSIITDGKDFTEWLVLKDANTLTFEIDREYTTNGQTVTLMPFYNIHHQFYNIYWYVDKEADKYEKMLNDITIDSLIPDGQQDELGHNLQGNDLSSTHYGYFTANGKTYRWRDAWGTATSYFSYDMAVDGNSQNYLYVSYWGSDVPFTKNGVTYTRHFDILVDNQVIATQLINNNKPGSPYNVFYEIPIELTAGKNKVTVKFQVKNASTCAGGILGLRTTRGIIEN